MYPISLSPKPVSPPRQGAGSEPVALRGERPHSPIPEPTPQQPVPTWLSTFHGVSGRKGGSGPQAQGPSAARFQGHGAVPRMWPGLVQQQRCPSPATFGVTQPRRWQSRDAQGAALIPSHFCPLFLPLPPSSFLRRGTFSPSGLIWACLAVSYFPPEAMHGARRGWGGIAADAVACGRSEGSTGMPFRWQVTITPNGSDWSLTEGLGRQAGGPESLGFVTEKAGWSSG